MYFYNCETVFVDERYDCE